jgi:hypothetical protein
MRTRKPTDIHEGLAAIDRRVVKAKQAAREAELAYNRGQEAIVNADKAHLDAQAAKVAGQPSEVEEATKALERTKSEALPQRDLEIARRAVELAEQERVAFLASHETEFEHYFAARYGETAQKVQDAESTIVASFAAWQEANREHFAFRRAIGRANDDIPQTPPGLRDTHKALQLARESRTTAA